MSSPAQGYGSPSASAPIPPQVQPAPPIDYSAFQPPPYIPRRNLSTESGLRFLNWTMMVYIITGLLGLLTAFIYAGMLSSLTSSDPDAVNDMLGASALTLTLSLASGGLGLIAIIFGIIGFVYMWNGKNEFGDAHAKKAKYALISLIMYIILAVTSAVVIMIMTLSVAMGVGPSHTPQQVFDQMMMANIVGGAIGLVAAIFLSLIGIFLILELSSAKYRRIMWVALVLNIVSQALSLVMIMYMMSLLRTTIASLDVNELISRISYMESAAGFISVIGLIATILMYLCVRDAYARVTEGEIKPTPIPYTPWPAPASYPQYGYEQGPYTGPPR